MKPFHHHPLWPFLSLPWAIILILACETLDPTARTDSTPSLSPTPIPESTTGLDATPPLSPTPKLWPVPDTLPKEGWTNISRPNGHVKVWWQMAATNHKALAETILSAMEDRIWPDLTVLMGREPLSDADANLMSNYQLQRNGGDGSFDIYIYPIKDFANAIQGQEKQYPPGCKEQPSAHKRPAWLQIDPNRNKNTKELLSTVTHEFMHAMQHTYDVFKPCTEYIWWAEASAEWAVDYVYPSDNTEHSSNQDFFENIDAPLEKEQYAYARYLFPFFLAGENHREASLIRKIWFNDQLYDSLEAIDVTLKQALPTRGGFAEQWHEFALYNWNREKWDHYKKWDEIKIGAITKDVRGTTPGRDEQGSFSEVKLEGKMDAAFEIPANVPHLAASYYHIKFTDTNIRSLTFYNGLKYKLSRQNRSLGPDPLDGEFISVPNHLPGEVYVLEPVPDPEEQTKGLSIRALVKINDQWQEEQLWTEDYYKFFCFDEAAERIQELVLIISNSEYQDRSYDLKPQGLSPTLFVSSVGCWRWGGEASREYTYPDLGPQYAAGKNVVWERVPFEEIPGAIPDANGVVFLPYIAFRLKSGAFEQKWSQVPTYCYGEACDPFPQGILYATNSCNVKGPITPTGPFLNYHSHLRIYMYTLSDHPDSSRYRYYGWGGIPDVEVPMTLTYTAGASSGSSHTYQGPTDPWFKPITTDFASAHPILTLKNGIIDDSFDAEHHPILFPEIEQWTSHTGKWKFVPLRE
jgi:hypothetical protein